MKHCIVWTFGFAVARARTRTHAHNNTVACLVILTGILTLPSNKSSPSLPCRDNKKVLEEKIPGADLKASRRLQRRRFLSSHLHSALSFSPPPFLLMTANVLQKVKRAMKARILFELKFLSGKKTLHMHNRTAAEKLKRRNYKSCMKIGCGQQLHTSEKGK